VSAIYAHACGKRIKAALNRDLFDVRMLLPEIKSACGLWKEFKNYTFKDSFMEVDEE